MKRYTMSGAAALEHTPAAPDRTARRCAAGFLNFDVVFQVWPNRASMARSIRMQERAGNSGHWQACQKLGQTEGY